MTDKTKKIGGGEYNTQFALDELRRRRALGHTPGCLCSSRDERICPKCDHKASFHGVGGCTICDCLETPESLGVAGLTPGVSCRKLRQYLGSRKIEVSE
jgi:hypothetical protein